MSRIVKLELVLFAKVPDPHEFLAQVFLVSFHIHEVEEF